MPLTLVYPQVGGGSGDPAWADTLRDALSVAVTYTTTTMAVDTYTGTQVNSQISSIGNGTNLANKKRLIYPAGCTINLTADVGIDFGTRSYFELDLTTATVNIQTNGTSLRSAGVFLQQCTGCTVRGGNFIGQMTNTGTAAAQASVHESIPGVVVRSGCTDIELVGITMQDIRGWPFWVAFDGGSVVPVGVWIHGGCTTTGGEMGIAVTAAENLLIEDNGAIVKNATYHAVDFEPDVATGHIRHVLIQRNTFDTWGCGGSALVDNYYLLAANPGYSGPPWSDMLDIIFRDNTIPVAVLDGAQGMRFRSVGPLPKTDIVITGNVSSDARTDSGGGSEFATVTNLTVTGNTQLNTLHVALVDTDTGGSGTHTITPNTT